jgi:hypothetical protein
MVYGCCRACFKAKSWSPRMLRLTQENLDAANRRLYIGKGIVENVTLEMWARSSSISTPPTIRCTGTGKAAFFHGYGALHVAARRTPLAARRADGAPGTNLLGIFDSRRSLASAGRRPSGEVGCRGVAPAGLN